MTSRAPLNAKMRRKTVCVVEDNHDARDLICALVQSMGADVQPFASAEEFLDSFDESRTACLVTDLRMPGMSGLELLEQLRRNGHLLPVIIISAHADVALTVRAMSASAMTVLPKPYKDQELWDVIRKALKRDVRFRLDQAHRTATQHRLAQPTPGERQVLDRIAKGKPNKAVAWELGISLRTVEDRRRKIYKKLGVDSLAGMMQVAIGKKYTGRIDDESA